MIDVNERKGRSRKRRERKGIKETELKLVSELMRNSRRSDRELAGAIGVSQPTVSRMVKNLEKDGIIREYTMKPDFQKLGYELLGLTFLNLKKTLTKEEAEKAREMTKRELLQSEFGIAMVERGMGLGHDGVIMAFYEDYASYARHMDILRKYEFLEISNIESFLISLQDEVRYRPLTLSILADHVLKLSKTAK